MSTLREDALALYTPPFKFLHGYVFDSSNRMVADQGGISGDNTVEGAVALQIRGWGRIGYMPHAKQLQDEIGAIVVDALNAYYAAQEAQGAQSVEPVGIVDEGDDGLFVDLETSKGVVVKRGDKLFTHPAPPPAPSVTETLAAHGIKLRTEFEPKPRDYFPEAAFGNTERAALIATLHEFVQAIGHTGAVRSVAMARKAADMLEADAQEIERTRKMYEKAHQGRADFRQAFREARKAQQVAVPATSAAIKRFEPELYDEDRVRMELDLDGDWVKYSDFLAQQVAVPAGYALVPIEPTPAILDAMSSSGWKTACYKAMLAAAAQGAKP